MAPEDWPPRREARRGSGIHCAGDLGEAGNWRILAWRSDALLGRSFVDIGEADPLHCVQVIQIAPELLEAVCSRERCSVIAKVVLAELARGIAEIMQEFRKRRSARPQIRWAAGQLRRDHTAAPRRRVREEGHNDCGGALLRLVVTRDAPLGSLP